MKAIIVDIKGEYAVALKKNGEFIKVRNKDSYKIGYEYDVPSHLLPGKTAKIVSIAAAFVLMLGIGAGVYSYSMPYSYIDLDINPSVEITVNVFDRIIHAEGLNSDGKLLLSEGDIKNRKLQEGINTILGNAVEQGYLKKDFENAIVVTVSSKNSGKAGQLEENIQTAAAEKLESASVGTEIVVEKVTIEKHGAAKDYGITPGKMNLINKLLEEDPDLRAEDFKDKPVKDIMKSIKELKDSGKENKGKNDKDKKDKDKKDKDKKDRVKKGESQEGTGQNDTVDEPDRGMSKQGKGNSKNDKSGKGKGTFTNPGKDKLEEREPGIIHKKNNGNNGQSSNGQKKNKKSDSEKGSSKEDDKGAKNKIKNAAGGLGKSNGGMKQK